MYIRWQRNGSIFNSPNNNKRNKPRREGEIVSRRDVEACYWGTRKQTKSDREWRNSLDYLVIILVDTGNDIFIDGEGADVSSWCRSANHATPRMLLMLLLE